MDLGVGLINKESSRSLAANADSSFPVSEGFEKRWLSFAKETLIERLRVMRLTISGDEVRSR